MVEYKAKNGNPVCTCGHHRGSHGSVLYMVVSFFIMAVLPILLTMFPEVIPLDSYMIIFPIISMGSGIFLMIYNIMGKQLFFKKNCIICNCNDFRVDVNIANNVLQDKTLFKLVFGGRTRVEM